MRLSIVAAMIVYAGAAQAETHRIYTATKGPLCRDASIAEMGQWTCPAPGDYVVGFLDEGNLVSVAVGRSQAARRNLVVTSQWRGAGKVFGDKMEWRIDDAGTPRAAILRAWSIQSQPNGSEREVQELKIFAVNPGVSCEFAVVDATRPNANEIAAGYADDAAKWHCAEK